MKDSASQELTGLVTRRRQIVGMIVAETNRSRPPPGATAAISSAIFAGCKAPGSN